MSEDMSVTLVEPNPPHKYYEYPEGYMCDGIAVGDQSQPYAECGYAPTHEAHLISAPPSEAVN